MNNTSDSSAKKLLVAVPVANGQLALHFGHCQEFAIFEVDGSTKEITAERHETPPPHEPDVLPAWLAEQGTDVIIAGGMGGRAQAIFAEKGIRVVTGAPCEPPRDIVARYVAGTLETGQNLCDH